MSFVSAEYLRGNVLPAEQHAAPDLPRVLHPNSHLKALTQPNDRRQNPGRDFKFLPFKSTCLVVRPIQRGRFASSKAAERSKYLGRGAALREDWKTVSPRIFPCLRGVVVVASSLPWRQPLPVLQKLQREDDVTAGHVT